MKQGNSLSNGWICLTGIVHGLLNFRYMFVFSSNRDFEILPDQREKEKATILTLQYLIHCDG